MSKGSHKDHAYIVYVYYVCKYYSYIIMPLSSHFTITPSLTFYRDSIELTLVVIYIPFNH